MKAFLTLQHGISSDVTDTNNSKNSVVSSLGTLYLELYDHNVPKTVSNFVTLLQQGQEEESSSSATTITRTKNKLGYQGCIFHRIIPNFMAQGGDMTEHISSMKDNTTIVIDDDDNDDTNNNYKTFPDENFIYQHNKVGILSMANSGPNTNQTQFFITFRPTPHLNNKHVVFGQVDLMKSSTTLNALENIPCHPKTNRPYRPVVIVRCGVLPDDNNDNITNPISPLHNTVQATTWSNQDDDEIDLDDDDVDDDDHNNNNVTHSIAVPPPQQQQEEEVVIEREDEQLQDESTLMNTTKLSKKKELMKIRMRQLKQKMNQAKQLNQQAVREEGEMTIAKTTTTMTSGNNINNNHLNGSKQRSLDPVQQNQNSHGVQLAKESNIDIKVLLQPAYENVMKQQRKQEKDELNQYDIKDYHNPEGQYRNYVRNIRSLPNNNNSYNNNDNSNTNTSLYDPTDIVTEDGVGTLKKERDAAHRISMELHRRIEKRQKKDRKRKQEQKRKELNDTSSSSSVAASGINLRNQKFNEKIARTFDAATSEIRHNLERGTAL